MDYLVVIAGVLAVAAVVSFVGMLLVWGFILILGCRNVFGDVVAWYRDYMKRVKLSRHEKQMEEVAASIEYMEDRAVTMDEVYRIFNDNVNQNEDREDEEDEEVAASLEFLEDEEATSSLESADRSLNAGVTSMTSMTSDEAAAEVERAFLESGSSGMLGGMSGETSSLNVGIPVHGVVKSSAVEDLENQAEAILCDFQDEEWGMEGSALNVG